MAYNEPVSFQYVGDKEVALRYVREARRRIFEFLKTLTASPVKSGRRVYNYPGGVTITVIVAGRVVKAVIDARSKESKLPKLPEDFVVYARTQEKPNGIDSQYPQQILRPLEDDWRTYFYDAAIEGYDDFTRKKGTYKNSRGETIFPDGVVHSGNIDWRGPDAERISWYGPDSRYFYDAYRQPNAQYGRFVFHLGQILLDVDAYCTAIDEDWPNRLVVGAGVREVNGVRWLHVVLARMTDVSTPVVTIPAFSVYLSECAPMSQVDFTVYRFRLTEDTASTKAMKWSVVVGSHESLWTAFADGAASPWVFSTDFRQLTTSFLGRQSVFAFTTANNTVMDTGAPPTVYNTRVEVAFGDDDDPTSVTYAMHSDTIAPGAGSAFLAVDYNADGERVEAHLLRKPYEQSTNALVMRIGQTEYPIFFRAVPRPGFVRRTVQRRLMWADLRSDTVAFSTHFDDAAGVDGVGGNYALEIAVEIYQGGRLLHRQTTATDAGSGYTELDSNVLDAAAGFSIAPYSWMYSMFATVAGTTTRATLSGHLYTMTAEPVHPSEGFGQFGARANTSGPSTPIVGENNFNTAPQDIHGHRVSNSAAALPGVVVASLSWTALPDGRSVHFITGSSLPTVTGVSGTDARYHPIWLLGQPIGGKPLLPTTP